MVEQQPVYGTLINLAARESLRLEDCYHYFNEEDDLEDRKTFHLEPNEFVLGHTLEVFNLPNNISAQFHLKSSIARAGLGHSLAGHCNPGWTNSTLTLELKNETRFHTLQLTPGMLIGQMVFYRHDEVDPEASYKSRGKFNNAHTVESNA